MLLVSTCLGAPLALAFTPLSSSSTAVPSSSTTPSPTWGSSSPLTAVATPVAPAAGTAVTWEFRKALNSDMALAHDYLERKGAIDLGISGMERNHAMGARIGTTIDTLMPGLRNGQMFFCSEIVNDQVEAPIGFCAYALRYYNLEGSPVMWMDDLYVDPSVRSRGAGRAMMDELADTAQKYRCSHLEWDVDIRNVRGMQFYSEKMGATLAGAQRGQVQRLAWNPWK